MNELPRTTAEEAEFARRMGRVMAPMLGSGVDLRDAERSASKIVAEELRAEGANPDAVDALLSQALERSNVGALFRHDEFLATAELHEALTEAFKAAGGRRLSPVGLLVEKRVVGVPTGYPMYLFLNESKHPGFPHVTVKIGDEKVNVSISDDPKVIAGNAKLVGIGAVLKAVKQNRAELKRQWDQTRPDDQKLENFKAGKPGAKRTEK